MAPILLCGQEKVMEVEGRAEEEATEASMSSRSCGRIQTVGSGSAVVGERRAEILEAHLGTCVGVTLCDSRRGIGGLLHVLLPEPTG